ncbi:MAG: class I SAM-dependent methyltransferase [Candidatus Adiutrix sp.]|jgi:SAM-dependent methyltransferase|nr:class I SAM-dependent methyltransferase [Candidatus Adiutrix sp.]
MTMSIKERVLSFSKAYSLFQRLLARPGVDVVSDSLKIASGCKILDIGCGPATVVERLPDSVEYCGFDPSEQYIETARLRYGGRPLHSFQVQGIDEADLGEKNGYFDLVMALGVVHHLNDEQAAKLFKLAEVALKPGGQFFSIDPVFISNQHPIAKWLASMDRGKYVRTPEHYKNLAETSFGGPAEQRIRSDALRLPYNHLIMKIVK